MHSSNFEIDYLRTTEELENNPYPWNLHTLCTSYYIEDHKLPTAGSISKSHEDTYTYENDLKSQEEDHRLPCHVLERVRKEGSYVYKVALSLSDTETIVVADFPRGDDGVQLYDKAYSQMWHMEQAFRHKMYVPDDIFPKNWMNKEE